jgi:hypothetical protein
VPPIYQPEVAAEAIYQAVQRRRREIYVTASTIKVVTAQKLVPGLVDRYLARFGWQGQLTDEPARAPAQSNLFEPIEAGDPGAHGRFEERARTLSPVTSLTLWLGAGGSRALFLFAPIFGTGLLLGRTWKARGGRDASRRKPPGPPRLPAAPGQRPVLIAQVRA